MTAVLVSLAYLVVGIFYAQGLWMLHFIERLRTAQAERVGLEKALREAKEYRLQIYEKTVVTHEERWGNPHEMEVLLLEIKDLKEDREKPVEALLEPNARDLKPEADLKEQLRKVLNPPHWSAKEAILRTLLWPAAILEEVLEFVSRFLRRFAEKLALLERTLNLLSRKLWKRLLGASFVKSVWKAILREEGLL
jgi:hypothetical protein